MSDPGSGCDLAWDRILVLYWIIDTPDQTNMAPSSNGIRMLDVVIGPVMPKQDPVTAEIFGEDVYTSSCDDSYFHEYILPERFVFSKMFRCFVLREKGYISMRN